MPQVAFQKQLTTKNDCSKPRCIPGAGASLALARCPKFIPAGGGRQHRAVAKFDQEHSFARSGECHFEQPPSSENIRRLGVIENIDGCCENWPLHAGISPAATSKAARYSAMMRQAASHGRMSPPPDELVVCILGGSRPPRIIGSVAQARWQTRRPLLGTHFLDPPLRE